MGNLITDSTSIWVRVRNGNTFPVLLGKSCSELHEYNPKDLVSFPDFLLFFFLWHCHCLLPACPSKNPNKPTFLHLYVHHLLLLPLSARHLQEEEKKGCFLVALFKVEEKEQEWLVVIGDTVYSKLWFIFFKRSKYFTADFLFTQLLRPNSAPMFQLTVWIKHKSSIPGVTGIVSFIQKEISGETLSELVENYLTLVILFFVENADLLKWIFLRTYIGCEEVRIRNKFSETERIIEKGTERMRSLGPHGSYQRQMMQAQGIDPK